MTKKNKQLANYLEKAALRLETHGWCRGNYIDNKGQTCLVGAVVKATPYGDFSERTNPLLVALKEAVYRDYSHGGDITEWNDKQKDKRKVIRFIRRTARKLAAA